MSVKQRWQAFSARVDALAPRERIMVLGAVLAVLAALGWMTALGPALHQQDVLRRQIAQQRDALAGIEAETAHKVAAGRDDPDAPRRERLASVRQDSTRIADELRAMQKGLVPPERVAPLLEAILRANGKLKLVAMKTLPVGSLSDIAAGTDGEAKKDAPEAKPHVKAPDLLYRHGVELTVRGSYLDMVDYMAALEALPTQLFWGRAQLDVEQYPSVRLTLTLYTLSLDPKWMKL
nr:type II secretion system protein GspM [uncultured Massilia sp.]